MVGRTQIRSFRNGLDVKRSSSCGTRTRITEFAKRRTPLPEFRNPGGAAVTARCGARPTHPHTSTGGQPNSTYSTVLLFPTSNQRRAHLTSGLQPALTPAHSVSSGVRVALKATQLWSGGDVANRGGSDSLEEARSVLSKKLR